MARATHPRPAALSASGGVAPIVPGDAAGLRDRVAKTERPTKITFAEMREMVVRGLLVYCADFRCSHSVAVSADHWPDDLRLSDILSRGLDAGSAASAVQMCGRISTGTRSRSKRWAPSAAVAAALISGRPQANE